MVVGGNFRSQLCAVVQVFCYASIGGNFSCAKSLFVVDVVVGTSRLGEGLQPSAFEIVTAVAVRCGVQGICRAVGNGCVAHLDKSVFNNRVVGKGGGTLFRYVAVAVVLVRRSVVVRCTLLQKLVTVYTKRYNMHAQTLNLWCNCGVLHFI